MTWWPPLLRELVVTSPWGLRTHPITGEPESMHTGVDLRADEGEPVYPCADGYVCRIFDDDTNGHGVQVIHGAPTGELLTWTAYVHFSKVLVKLGDPVYAATPRRLAGEVVPAATVLGLAGSTGSSTRPHLHLELREGYSLGHSERVDPVARMRLVTRMKA